jgi:hypothetical protein
LEDRSEDLLFQFSTGTLTRFYLEEEDEVAELFSVGQPFPRLASAAEAAHPETKGEVDSDFCTGANLKASIGTQTVDSYSSSSSTAAYKEVEELKSENRALKVQLSAVALERDALKQRLMDAVLQQTEFASVSTSASSSHIHSSFSARDDDAIMIGNHQLHDVNERLSHDNEQLKRELNLLKLELESATNTIDQLRNSHQESTRAEDDLAQLVHSLRLKNNNNSSEYEEKQYVLLQGRLEEEIEKVSALRSKLLEVSEDLREKTSLWAQEKAALDFRVLLLENHKADLEQSVRQLTLIAIFPIFESNSALNNHTGLDSRKERTHSTE